MNKEFTLTKKEFIKRSMKGEVFIHDNKKYFYDTSYKNPFRVESYSLDNGWIYFNDKTLFTLEEPKPVIERRWKWLKDFNNYTQESSGYYPDKNNQNKAWYKKEDDYIDVEVPNENT